MEDYDFTLEFHFGKAKVAADALSKKSHATLANVAIHEWEVLNYNSESNMFLGEINDKGPTLFLLEIQPKLYRQMTKVQHDR